MTGGQDVTEGPTYRRWDPRLAHWSGSTALKVAADRQNQPCTSWTDHSPWWTRGPFQLSCGW
jgi:hypothetical protein